MNVFSEALASVKPLFMQRTGYFVKGCETIGKRFHTRMCSSIPDINKNLQRCFIFVMAISRWR